MTKALAHGLPQQTGLPHPRSCLRPVSGKAPVRISFVTGGDKDHYIEKLGWGNCLNATINLFASCAPGKTDPSDRMLSLLLEYYKKNHGLAGLSLATEHDYPKESGLGGSAAHCVAIIRALDKAAGVKRSDYDVALLANDVERKWMGVDGGYQDQFASAFGGFNYMVFSGDPQRPKVEVRPLKLSKDAISKLEAVTLLVYIPREVSGSEIHRSMRQNTERMAHYMSVKRELCSLAKEELLEGDIEAFAKTVDLEYQLKKKQSPLTTTQNMDMVYRAARAHGAMGMKFMGAGGGGCAIIFSEDKEGLAVALRDYVKVIDFRFGGAEDAR